MSPHWLLGRVYILDCNDYNKDTFTKVTLQPQTDGILWSPLKNPNNSDLRQRKRDFQWVWCQHGKLLLLLVWIHSGWTQATLTGPRWRWLDVTTPTRLRAPRFCRAAASQPYIQQHSGVGAKLGPAIWEPIVSINDFRLNSSTTRGHNTQHACMGKLWYAARWTSEIHSIVAES